MQHHDGLGEAARPGLRFGKRVVQRLGQFVVYRSDSAGAGNRRWRHDHRFAIAGLTLEEACLAPGMQDAASKRPVMDRTAAHEAGKAGADLPLFPVDFVSEEGADRAELGFDGLVVEFVGVQPRHECGRAELMARKMNRDARHARGTAAYAERAGRRADASQSHYQPPVVPQPVHRLRPL